MFAASLAEAAAISNAKRTPEERERLHQEYEAEQARKKQEKMDEIASVRNMKPAEYQERAKKLAVIILDIMDQMKTELEPQVEAYANTLLGQVLPLEDQSSWRELQRLFEWVKSESLKEELLGQGTRIEWKWERNLPRIEILYFHSFMDTQITMVLTWPFWSYARARLEPEWIQFLEQTQIKQQLDKAAMLRGELERECRRLGVDPNDPVVFLGKDTEDEHEEDEAD